MVDAAPPPRRLARHLLEIGAVTLSPEAPYTWASGLRSPIYCDNRLTLGFPSVRRAIAEGFEAELDRHTVEAQVVVGTATAGIPHAAWLAERLQLPMAYVRSSPKAHGRGNQVEGRVEPGQTVVVVEDLVSTGSSSVAVVDVLRSAGAQVAAVLAIFSYGFDRAERQFRDAGVPLYTLTGLDALLAEAEASGRLSPEAVASLRAWRQDPEAWSARWS